MRCPTGREGRFPCNKAPQAPQAPLARLHPESGLPLGEHCNSFWLSLNFRAGQPYPRTGRLLIVTLFGGSPQRLPWPRHVTPVGALSLQTKESDFDPTPGGAGRYSPPAVIG